MGVFTGPWAVWRTPVRAVRGVYLKSSGCVHPASLQAMGAVEKGYIRDVRDIHAPEGKGEGFVG